MYLGKRIFIFEYVSGGGLNKDDIPISLFCEAFGMLISIIKDFKLLGFEVSTLLDYRIHNLSIILPECNIITIEEDDSFLHEFEILVKESDYNFVIAPESENILFELTKIVKTYNKTLLSTNLKGIRIGSSKLNTYYYFQTNKLLTPKTYLIPLRKNLLDIDFILQKFDELKNPIIIKPEDGVGAELIFLFKTKEQIKDFFQNNYSKVDKNRRYILQDYIKGKDLSISLIGLPKSLNNEFKNPLILSINSQHISINLKCDSFYLGGYTPIQNYQETLLELTEILKKVDFSSFKGYFGIDLIRSEESKFYFIEINPRITTSYIGIRNILKENPSKLILESQIGNSMPNDVTIQFTSIFKKLNMRYSKPQLNSQSKDDLINDLMNGIPELVTPPISLNKSDHYTCFIATKTKDFSSSEKRVEEIIQLLQMRGFETTI